MVHFEGVFIQICYFSSSAAFPHKKFPCENVYLLLHDSTVTCSWICIYKDHRSIIIKEMSSLWTDFILKRQQKKKKKNSKLKHSSVSILNPEREKKDKPWFASIKEQLGMSVCVMISWHFCLHFCIVYKVMYRRLKGERMFPSICYVSIHKCLWDQQKGCYCYNQLNCTNNVQVRPKLNMFYDVLIEQGKLRYPMSDLNYLTFSDSLS